MNITVLLLGLACIVIYYYIQVDKEVNRKKKNLNFIFALLSILAFIGQFYLSFQSERKSGFRIEKLITQNEQLSMINDSIQKTNLIYLDSIISISNNLNSQYDLNQAIYENNIKLLDDKIALNNQINQLKNELNRTKDQVNNNTKRSKTNRLIYHGHKKNQLKNGNYQLLLRYNYENEMPILEMEFEVFINNIDTSRIVKFSYMSSPGGIGTISNEILDNGKKASFKIKDFIKRDHIQIVLITDSKTDFLIKCNKCDKDMKGDFNNL